MRDILEYLADRAIKQPDAIAFRDDDGAISYGRLARRVQGMSEILQDGLGTVGILAPNGIDWVVCDLACKHASRTMVPIPAFFSPEQVAHIINDAEIEMIVCTADMAPALSPSSVRIARIDGAPEKPFSLPQSINWRQIIYTSGTTGRPKGVVLDRAQINTSIEALADTIALTADGCYLSILPFALLLEQICGIYIPLKAGIESRLSARVARACFQGDFKTLINGINEAQPSYLVLVPELLRGWVAALERTGTTAPPSLRFVAVGGAHVGQALAEQAWQLGIPVHEGYGLSECCSVVAVNRPGARRPNTVGQVLPGLRVEIEQGEIVVYGATVMEGYLGGAPVDHCWRTGDMGELDWDGYLRVYGRRDDLIVTTLGRNLSPAWIEGMILNDPNFLFAAVIGDDLAFPVAIVVPSQAGEAWMRAATADDLGKFVNELCVEAPVYARPVETHVTDMATLVSNRLLNPQGKPDRHRLQAYFINQLTAQCA